MTKITSVAELIKQGYRVFVKHYRYIGNPKHSHNLASYTHIRAENQQKLIRAKGGLTTIEVCDRYGNTICKAESRCSRSDPFNRKLAVQICLGRALSQMEAVTPTVGVPSYISNLV